MRPAFLDVDTQVDFVEPGGKLYARGAEAIKPRLARLVALARAAGIPLVASVDAHDAKDAEFAQYPPHCLRGTKGQEKLAVTRTGQEVLVASARAKTLPDPRKEHVVLEKQVFPVFGNENAEAIFAKTGADTFFVFGVVTEVCVKAAVLGLLERGYAVRIVSDAIWPIEEKAGEAAKKEMLAKGASLVTTDEVVRSLAPAGTHAHKKLARIEIVLDRTAGSRCDEGFLRLKRLRLKNHYEDGTTSRDYSCDILSRPGTDAVAVALWHREGTKVLVHLRLGTRAAVYFRRDKKAELVQPDDRVYDTIEEVVAGILEKDDTGPEGLRRRGSLEAHEEAGFALSPGDVKLLGAGFFATPGITDEKVYLAHAEIDPSSKGPIEGDGSVMEEGASTVVRDLRGAIEACRRGEIVDAKTEIALHRLADAIGYLPQLGMWKDELPPELRARWSGLGV